MKTWRICSHSNIICDKSTSFHMAAILLPLWLTKLIQAIVMGVYCTWTQKEMLIFQLYTGWGLYPGPETNDLLQCQSLDFSVDIYNRTTALKMFKMKIIEMPSCRYVTPGDKSLHNCLFACQHVQSNKP